MNRNKSQLVQMVVDSTGRGDKTTLIAQYLDFGVEDLGRMHPFDQIRTQVDVPLNVLDTQVQLPLNVSQIVELRLLVPASPTLSYPMELKRKVWFTERFPNVLGSTITGRPVFAYRDNNQLYMDRKSNGVYTIRITCTQNGCFPPTDGPANIPRADEALVAYSTSRLFRSIEQYDDAAQWYAEYERISRRLIDDVNREIGVKMTADMWYRRSPVQVNQPWLDPFEGRDRG